jgi:ribose-phosphate pyrophosphokinase
MTPLIFNFPFPSPLGLLIIQGMKAKEGVFFLKSFPDGESYLRLESAVKDRLVIINAPLFHPNGWILDLVFLADTLRSQGAKQVILLAPYLAYMRQDKIFRPGEALTSASFSCLLSSHVDYLITVDPHLHRYHSLSDIYSIPTHVIHAAPLVSSWIHENVQDPFLIGPDRESAQWVEEIAQDLPFIVLNKTRDQEGNVKISWPKDVSLGKRTPVLIDDIISSGGTLIEALSHLKREKTKPPLCLAIHAVFAENSYEKLMAAGAHKIITCNTIPHPSNQIDLSLLLLKVLQELPQ